MRASVFRVGSLDCLLFLSFLIALASCYSPSHAQSNNKGFGKKPLAEKQKKDAVNAAASSLADSERQYLKPYALELTGEIDDDSNEFVGDRGIRSLKDRSPGDVLLEIPLKDTITVNQIRSRLASCARDGNEEYNEEESLAIGLLRLRDEAADPYVSNVLPKKHFNVWTLPADLWEITSAVLPRCYAETFAATRQRVNKFAIQIAEATSTNSGDAFTLDDALWAFSMVRSRSLAVPELEDDNANAGHMLALIPGLDLMNHAFGSGTKLQLVVDDSNEGSLMSKWVVTSSDSITAGDEVFLSYGDDKDNWKLLLTYGFCVPENPNAVVFWTWQDLLDAAHEVRPDTFTEPVCRQLLRHPQLEAYTVTSEQRATFSYDASTDTPRESLQNGLTMLNSLAAQLGKPESENDALATQVLGELRRKRLEDLLIGQNRLKDQQSKLEKRSDKPENYSEWQPFFQSLRIALESEQRQLEALLP